MCSQRILRRLRLIKGKRSKSKPPIQEILWKAIGSLQQHNKSSSNQSSSSSTFVNDARTVIKLADAWLKHQVIPRLKELVEAIHHLKNNRDLETIVGIIPNQEMCPSMRSKLINIISKVARYRDVARYLFRLSKRSTLARHMNLLPVVLPKDMYSRLQTQSYASLSAVFTRIATSGQKSNIGRIYQPMKLTEDQANEEFVALTNKTLSEAKIHAEIQLLYFLELNPSKLPPRIIASSKDACYLCNAFIQMHGKMHTARTHGRLYPGWRLPTISKLIGLEQSFNTILAKHIRSSIATLILRGQKTVYPDPNESTLLTLPYSASTLRSLLSSREVIGKQESFMQPPRSRSTSTNQDSKAESEKVTSYIEKEPKDEDLATSSSNIGLTRASASGSVREVSLCSIDENGKDLIQGRELILGGEKNLYNAGHLELHTVIAEREPQAQLSGTHQYPKYSLEWLIPEDVESFKARGNDVVVDVNSLQQETTYELNEEGCLLIATRGVLVKIACRR
jgi:hypothetical protein